MRKLSAPMASYLLHIARYGQCPSLSGSALQTANAVETRGFLNRGLISVQLTPLGWSALIESAPVTVFNLLDELRSVADAMYADDLAFGYDTAPRPTSADVNTWATKATGWAQRPDGYSYAAEGDTEPILASEMHDAAPVLDAWRAAEEAYLSQTVAVDAQGNPRSLADLNAAQKAGLISGPSPVPDTYVRHVDESHEMALIMETQRAYLAGELDHEEEDIDALRPVFAPLVSDVDTAPTCPACGMHQFVGLANLIDGLLVCDDCASNARRISDTAPMSVAQASLWTEDFSRDSGYGPDYSGGPDVLAEMDREHQEWRDTETALAAESETAVYVPPADLRPYTAPRAGDSVYDAASGQHGTVHRVVSPNTVRVRWDRKHGRHLVAVSALLVEHAPCAFPGDQEHDHEMCHDAVLDAPTYQLGTYVVSDEDLWNGAEQTKSFLDSIRTQIRNSSTDDDAETFRPTGGCA